MTTTMTTTKSPSLRRFTANSVLACMLRSSMGCAKRGIACKCKVAARSAAIGGCAYHATLCCEAARCCAAKQHIAVLRSSTLLCCKAALCCAAKQHVAVLRSSTWLCCEAALGAKRRNRGAKRRARYGSSCNHHGIPPWRICLAWFPRIWFHAEKGLCSVAELDHYRGLAILIPR